MSIWIDYKHKNQEKNSFNKNFTFDLPKFTLNKESKEESKEELKLKNEYIDIDLSKYSLNEEPKEEPKLINKYINIDLDKYSKGGYIKKKRVLNPSIWICK